MRGEAVVLSHEPGHEPAVHGDLASVIGSCLLTARRLALTLGTRQLAPGNQGLVVSFRHVQADEVLLSLHEKCRPYTGGLGAHGLRGRNAAVTAGFFLT